MRRWLLRILVCVVFGLVVTVGLAWWGAAFVRPTMTAWFNVVDESEREIWQIARRDGSVTTTVVSDRRSRTRGVDVIEPHIHDSIIPRWADLWTRLSAPGVREYRRFEASGWPFRALFLEVREFGSQPPKTQYGAIDTGLSYTDLAQWVASRDLPYFPIWLGLLGNIAVYGSALLLIWCGVIGLRNRFVRAPGLCPSCKYDLRGNFDAGCSECGWNRLK